MYLDQKRSNRWKWHSAVMVCWLVKKVSRTRSYETLAAEKTLTFLPHLKVVLPHSRNSLHRMLKTFMIFFLLRNQAIAERQTVVIRTKFCHIPVSQICQSDERDGFLSMDDFLSMVHVALKLRSDIYVRKAYAPWAFSPWEWAEWWRWQ